jgi:hypothetical protein
MNSLDILFKTSRFNLSKVGEHFINPCCFGEDLAAWLRTKLSDRSIEVRQPYQEDWGWELPAKQGSDSYYLCMSGNSDNSANKDEGEWRIIVEKRRSIWHRVSGVGKIAADDPKWHGSSKRFCPVNPQLGTCTARSRRRTSLRRLRWRERVRPPVAKSPFHQQFSIGEIA